MKFMSAIKTKITEAKNELVDAITKLGSPDDLDDPPKKTSPGADGSTSIAPPQTSPPVKKPTIVMCIGRRNQPPESISK